MELANETLKSGHTSVDVSPLIQTGIHYIHSKLTPEERLSALLATMYDVQARVKEIQEWVFTPWYKRAWLWARSFFV